MNRLFILPVLLLTLLVETPAFSAEKTSLEYAKMGRPLYCVIQCSFYAGKFKDKTEAERLTKLGIKIGREFLTAADSGKINKKDWSSNVPVYFGLIGVCPSPLILGHYFGTGKGLDMARKRHPDDYILKLLREIEVKLSAGSDVASACRGVGISDATYYNWRSSMGATAIAR